MNPAIGKHGEMNEKSGNLLMRKSTNSRVNRKLVRDTMNMPTDRFSIPTIDETSDDQKSEILDDLSITISTEHVASISGVLSKRSILWACDSLERLQIKLTLTNIGIFTVALTTFMPRTLTYVIIYPFYRLVFGTLYPAYASYKAVRTKNVKEYVKWMMYWIVFALFTCAETFTDVFFSFWFPFYYEIKVILVLWLLSPATKGSSILYRRFVHPALSRREAEIDEALARATEQGYTAVLHLGTRGVNYATTVLMQTAIKGGGGLVQQLKKSYSLSDLTGEKEDENRNNPDAPDESDFVEPRRRERVGRRGYSPRRTQSSSNRVEMYFSEVDVDVRQPRSREPVASLTNIRSSDDISSGYSSGEALQSHRNASQTDTLVRTSSVGARTRAKPRTTTKKSPEDEMDSDRYELPSLDIIPFPPALSFLSAEQALHLLSIFSQGENNNSKYIQNEPKSKSSSPETSVEDSFADSLSEFPDESERVTKGLEKTGTVDVCKITGEICQEKFSELKELLNSAHRAVTNIVSSQEKLDGISGYEKGLSTDPGTRNVTRSNSDCGLRAGKYHKKPAPKVPITRSRDNIEDVHAPEASALKATLVIKTGTVKTFSNVNNTKDVFLAHAPVSKKKKFHKKSKEGFTKLLTIPKTLLHNALHKEQNDESESSDSTLSRSRSASTGSRELRVPEESSNLEENVHKSPGVLEKGDELESAKENTEYWVDDNQRSGDKRDSRMWIREMSRSPTRRIVEPKKERADD